MNPLVRGLSPSSRKTVREVATAPAAAGTLFFCTAQQMTAPGRAILSDCVEGIHEMAVWPKTQFIDNDLWSVFGMEPCSGSNVGKPIYFGG